MYAGERPSAASLGGLGQWSIGFSRSALADLARVAEPTRRESARTALFSERQQRTQIYVLGKGWACAYRDFSDGRRHVSEIYLPGDVIGLAEAWTDQCGPAVVSLTEVLITGFECDDLRALARTSPEVAEGIATTLAGSVNTLMQRCAGLARQTAYERVAAMLWSMRARLQPHGGPQLHSFPCPVSQAVMSDALGLSAVHVNRSLRQLAQDGVLRKHSHEVEVLDNDALEGIVRV